MLLIYHVTSMSYLTMSRDVFLVGRTMGDLVIPDPALSSKHMQFMIEGNDLFVMDLGSKNRTIVNRAEILPNTKVRLQENSFIEIGTNTFIATSNKNITYKDVNAIVDQNMARNVVKQEGVKAVADLKERIKEEITKLMSTSTMAQEEIMSHEALIQKLQQNLTTLDESFEREMRKVEEAKQKLLQQVQDKKNEIYGRIDGLKEEIDHLKDKIERSQVEAEAKKKKLGSTRIPGME